ncbi:hypothetical protein MKW98_032315 [Papaver atlanticum]|uniref:Pentatricopeptide repeat-containing protein n=1 Tax=Papaver atlanticum TaxID=357466 RepID=A0AAD4XDL1_9MAGN|nr:hypothetical protein MKW98_032315 [Papaver atlanticum]
MRVSPNNFTFLFKSCQAYDDLDTGRELHTHVVKFGFGSHVFVQNTVLGFYSKRNENVGYVVVCAYMNHGEMKLAVELFKSMEERNVVSWNLVVSGLAKRGEMEPARLLFEEMISWNAAMKNARLGLGNEVSWNAMISGYMRNGDMKNAKLIFNQMLVKSVVSCTAMISGYATVGDVGEMSSLFYSMPVKNVTTWNAMIAGFVQNHKFDQALEVFHRRLMDGECKQDETTLLSENGCMIDLLSRAGKLEEAYTLITSMSMKPNAQMLEVVTKKILDLEPSNPAYLMMISNLNASTGRWEDKEGIKKVPGSSSIQVENKVHEFLVKDTKHENRMEIFKTVGITEKRENVLLGMA